MSNLLFLVHRIPFPPDKGDKIRSFNMLRHLSSRHNVFLAGFVDTEEDWKYVDELRKYCAEVHFRPLRRWRSRLSAFFSLFGWRSLSVAYYADGGLRQWVDDLVSRHPVDSVVCFSSTMAQFLPYEKLKASAVVADFVDLDSDKWRQYASESKWPLSQVYAYEAQALARYETEVVGKVDTVTLVSAGERDLLFSRLGRDKGKIEIIRNGVDIEFFDPANEYERPYEAGIPVAVFTGAMDYFANVQGVKWFAECIWPSVRQKVPTAEFWIVGSKPTSEVEALGSIEGVRVTGYVADVRPYLKFAHVAVTPLMLARGVQNKVLEALAMDLPVIATPQALQGVEGSLPASVTSVADPDQFAEATSRYLGTSSDASVGLGRAYVRQNYDWERNLSAIDQILRDVLARKSRLGD